MKRFFLRKEICGISIFIFILNFYADISFASMDAVNKQASQNESSVSVQESTSNAELLMLAGGVAQGAVAVYHFKKCSGWNEHCFMGALSAVQALQNLEAGNQAGIDKELSLSGEGVADSGGSGLASSGVLGDYLGYDLPESLTAEQVDTLRELELGMRSLEKNPNVAADFKNKTMKDKYGNVKKISDLATPAGMAAGGMSPDGIARALASAKKIEDEYLTKINSSSLGLDGGSGGFSASTGSDGAAGGLNFPGNQSGTIPSNVREPTNMAGLQKDFNGEPIGVSADSLFKMMKRRYEVKTKQDAFY